MRSRVVGEKWRRGGTGAGLALLALGIATASCADAAGPGRIYEAAIHSLTPEDLKEKELFVSSRLIEADYPPAPQDVLDHLADAGIPTATARTLDDTRKATVYMTLVDTLEAGRYQLGLFVSLGERMGQMGRGDSWWKMTVECQDACSVSEKVRSSQVEWGRVRGR